MTILRLTAPLLVCLAWTGLARLYAADITYPTAITASDDVVIGGAAPTATAAGQVNIGGGQLWTAGHVYVGGQLNLVNQAQINFKNAAGTYRQWAQWYSDNNIYYTNQDGAHIFRTGAGAVEAMRIDATGNVGIAIQAPVSKFHVVQSVAGYDSFYATNSASNNVVRFTAATGFSNYLDWYSGTGAGALIFRNAGTEVARIDASGNVGIGTAAPRAKVDVAGTLVVRDNAGASPRAIAGASGGDYGSIGYGFLPTNTTGSYTYSSNDFASRIEFTQGGFRFKTAPTGTTGQAITSTDVMTVTQAGNVGIGTTSPGSKLQVIGGTLRSDVNAVGTSLIVSGTGSNLQVKHDGTQNAALFNSGGGIEIRQNDGVLPGLTVQSNGNVGVGTTAPVSKLQVVNGTLRSDMSAVGTTLVVSGTGSNLQVKHDGTTNAALFNSGGGIEIRQNDGTSPGLTVQSNGNVGIGTINPTNKLTVAGTISAMEVKVTATGADYVFEDGYKLRTLDEVAQYVAREKHLPDIAPAKQMQAEGMPVSEVVTKQLAKIEELTLYAIAMDKRNARLEAENARLTATQAQLAADQAALRTENTALKAEQAMRMQDIARRLAALEAAR